MARNANVNWNNGEEFGKPGSSIYPEQATRAVLQDIRDELQALHRLLACPNVQKGVVAMASLDKHMRKRFPVKKKTS